MAQAVSNDALWVKLSEMDKKLDEFPVKQKSPVPTQEPVENKFDFEKAKREIIVEVKKELGSLERHYDDNFKAKKQDIGILNGNILKILNVVNQIQKQQRAPVESQENEKEFHFNFYFFKIRKTSFAIAMLALLVLILTLFCMKQQNDYSLLLDEYYRQGITIQELDREIKVLDKKQLKEQKKK